MISVKSLSAFGRKVANEAKMGAYYTNPEHCKWISNLLHFSDTEETACLEPSIGDGRAIKEVTKKQNNPNIKIFGVELNPDTCCQIRQDPNIFEILEADFTSDVRISNGVFTFCFGNPPYMDDVEGGRIEKTFLEKVTNYMKKDGVVVWVIPYSVLRTDEYVKTWCTRYTTEFLFKFHEKEFEKYHQVVIIGRKRAGIGCLISDVEEVQQKLLKLDNIPELPENYSGRKLEVPPSKEKSVKVFTTLSFNEDEGLDMVRKMSNMGKIFDTIMSPVPYSSKHYDRPPIPLKNDSKFLCAVSGVGEGLSGSEDNRDLHLQRGVAEVVEDSKLVAGSNNTTIEKVTSYTKVTMTIIESDGKISVLE